MNTREIASEYRMAQWTQVIQERVAKGERIKDFCQRRGISRNTYFYWQRKLRQAACQEVLPAAKSKETQELIPMGWAVCEQAQPGVEERAVIIEIGSFRVRVGVETPPEQLEKICRVLMKLC